jgi:hypothetical protein
MSSIVERLTEGVVNRDMKAEGAALLRKWERTGLLEGLSNDRQRQSMSRLLENQAKELLRESSSMFSLPSLSQLFVAFSLASSLTISFPFSQ